MNNVSSYVIEKEERESDLLAIGLMLALEVGHTLVK